METQDTMATRERLRTERSTLEQASRSAAGNRAPVDLDQTSIGRLSRMDAMQVQAMAVATEGRRMAAIRRIDHALARLDAGTYGVCVVCGEDIAPKRLDLDPAVPTCLDCTAGRRG